MSSHQRWTIDIILSATTHHTLVVATPCTKDICLFGELLLEALVGDASSVAAHVVHASDRHGIPDSMSDSWTVVLRRALLDGCRSPRMVLWKESAYRTAWLLRQIMANIFGTSVGVMLLDDATARTFELCLQQKCCEMSGQTQKTLE